jgi:hypothetical protein
MLSHDFCWCSLNHGPLKPVELEAAHIPNRGVAPTVPLFCRFPVPSTEVNPGYESGSSGSTRSPKASKNIGRGSAPGAGANAAICPGSSFNHRARCSSPASVHRSLRPVNRSDVRRFSSSAAVSGKRGPAQNPPWLPAPASRLIPSLFWPNQRRSSARSISSDRSKPSLPQMPSTPPPALSSLSTFPTPWALCTNPGNQARLPPQRLWRQPRRRSN